VYLRIDPSNGVPLGVQIASGLRLAILTQRLRPGEQVPAARTMAADLHVNFHTVRKAYGELEAQGLFEFRRGLGTFVTASRKPRTAELRHQVRAHIEAMARDLAGIEIASEKLEAIVCSELARLHSPATSKS
jgi:GntR family transcriptional regulator